MVGKEELLQMNITGFLGNKENKICDSVLYQLDNNLIKLVFLDF